MSCISGIEFMLRTRLPCLNEFISPTGISVSSILLSYKEKSLNIILIYLFFLYTFIFFQIFTKEQQSIKCLLSLLNYYKTLYDYLLIIHSSMYYTFVLLIYKKIKFILIYTLHLCVITYIFNNLHLCAIKFST